MLILASASPRRKTLLENSGLDFIIYPAEREINPVGSLSPEEYAVESAYAKALEVAAKFDTTNIVLGADTIVYLDGEIIGKPKDKADAYGMLKKLSGNTHRVYTGYALVKDGKITKGCEVTKVTFRVLEDDEIYAYIDSGEPMDKAGAYGVQERGCVFVKAIDGDFYNVMGLPICSVYTEIRSILRENKT